MTPSILFLGYIFTKEWINRYQKKKIIVNNMLLIPMFINGIATLISCNESGVFYITSNNIYERGHLFFVLPCVCYIYFGYNLYFIYKHRKKFIYSELVMFSLFYIVPAVFTIIQLKYFIYLTAWNSTAIIIVITYIFILSNQAYRDSLTGLENRLSYERYAQNINYKKNKKNSKLFMIYIDLDEFKTINDQYGHCEGDEALKTFASLLVDSFSLRQKKLIWLGGDEFLILLEENHSQKVEVYIENLTKNLKAYNDTGEKPYKIRFSYGMAGYINTYENVYELLKYTDQLMYEQKQNRRSKL